MRTSLEFAILSVLCSVLVLTTGTSTQRSIEVIAPADRTEAVLHDSPPGILLGTASGNVANYKRYVIIEGRRVQVFFDHERWIRVMPLDENNELQDKGPYWVRWGMVGDRSNDFEPVDLCNKNTLPADCDKQREKLAEKIKALINN